MTIEMQRDRWGKLGPISEIVRDSIHDPSIEFFDEEWASFPLWYVVLLSKLNALIRPEEIEFLTAEAGDNGVPTGRLFLLTDTQVVEASVPADSGQHPVAVWSRKDLNQLSVDDISRFALPEYPLRGYAEHPQKIAIELRYIGQEVISLPFAGSSRLCSDRLHQILPSLQIDIAAIPPRLNRG